VIGRTVSHYRITRQLGAGGMGVVYEAEDLDLKVTRALKFLPPHNAATDEDRNRLEREARAAAALEHPNICQVHEIGRGGDQTFIVMSYLEGLTLAERLADQEPLPVSEALDIAMQVGKALSRAHEAGVIHRDIKPANIMLTEGGPAVVMDFGLAKVSDLTRVTKTGATLGTAAYMSPEQARGIPVDSRTDVWSIGVVLYEMLTGRQPFGGDHLAAVAYAVQHVEPESPTRVRPEIPIDLERVVERAMAKDPSGRYQTIDEFLADLEAVQAERDPDHKTLRHSRLRRFRQKRKFVAGTLVAALLAIVVILSWPHPHQIQALAVLPFANLSGDAEQEIYAAGMTDALIFQLSGLVPRVVSRQTVMNYRDSDKTLPEIARELNVDAVVESSLLKMDGRIKASVRLVKADDEVTLWAETYERPIDNILAMYGQVTRDIARAINLELSADEEEKLFAATVVDPAAYEAYLKGRYWLGKDKNPDNAMKSVSFFEKSISLDPKFAPAYAGLASIQTTLFVLTGRTEKQHPRLAREAATKALDLDPDSAEAHSAMAAVHMLVDLDWEAAEREWSLIPDREREHKIGYPEFLCFSGRFEEAIDWSRKAHEKEPMSPDRIGSLAMSLRFARRYTEALPVYENLLEFYPDEYWGKYGLAVCLERTGRHQEAEEVFPGSPTSSDMLIMGDRQRVQGVVEELLRIVDETGTRDKAFHLSRHYAWLGDKDQALTWLTVASEEYPGDLFCINIMQEFDFLRSNPEFMVCLRQAGFTDKIIAASKAMTREDILGDS